MRRLGSFKLSGVDAVSGDTCVAALAHLFHDVTVEGTSGQIQAE